MPIGNINAILILFGNYAENAETIECEFRILKDAKKNEIVIIIYLNFNRELWITRNEKTMLSNLLENIFGDNKLPKNNI